MTDEMIVGRKAIIKYLSVPLDLSSDPRTAWNKILRWRKHQGMEKVFHRDVTGRPFVIVTEIRKWIMETDNKTQRVPRGFEVKGSKDTVLEN